MEACQLPSEQQESTEQQTIIENKIVVVNENGNDDNTPYSYYSVYLSNLNENKISPVWGLTVAWTLHK